MWVTYQGPSDFVVKYEYEPHNFVKLYKGIPQLVCKHCGLVTLRNDFTRWCISKGCLNEYHSGYKAAMRGRYI